jgi:hypothetical protein
MNGSMSDPAMGKGRSSVYQFMAVWDEIGAKPQRERMASLVAVEGVVV